MAQLLRSEVDARFTWDFTHIFASDEAWEEAYAKAEQAIKEIDTVPGTLGASAAAMAAGLGKIYDACRQMELVYLYAMLRKNVDNGDPKYQTMQGRAVNLSVAFWSPKFLPWTTAVWQNFCRIPH